ncbi:MAG: hypothetical protein P1U36_05880 [Legionellaceae bacterium]|nr:hypothetical protein [Legionellaceae bacterium]
MFTPDQITQLVLKVNHTFAAQLELTEKKQRLNASPTLRSVTPRPATPIPAGLERSSPIKFWASSFDRVMEASDKFADTLALQSIETTEEDAINVLREKAITLKNEYRQCFMSINGDESPDQANALYCTAKEQAELVFKAAYKDPNRNPIEDAKAQFIASFTMALMTLAPTSRPTTSSPWSKDLLCLDDSDSDVEDIDTSFKSINI